MITTITFDQAAKILESNAFSDLNTMVFPNILVEKDYIVIEYDNNDDLKFSEKLTFADHAFVIDTEKGQMEVFSGADRLFHLQIYMNATPEFCEKLIGA